MKIGLVRHFKVKHKRPKKFLISRQEIEDWFKGYETADIDYRPTDLQDVDWKKCFSSPVDRAYKTANSIYKGNIQQSDHLKELEILPLLDKKGKLPFLMWGLHIRSRSLNTNKITEAFQSRIQAFVDELLQENQEDVLVVSHGFVMMSLQKELIRRGFQGRKFASPENGKLYVFDSIN